MKTDDSILSYDARLSPVQAEIAHVLRAEIEAALPKATSKVWHGHPVWFDGENPVVGYDARKSTVNILFWNGQELGEAGLVPVGKFRAAGTQFAEAADIDRVSLRRWLKKARANVFDGVTHFRKLREAAKAKKSVDASPKPAKKTVTKPKVVVKKRKP